MTTASVSALDIAIVAVTLLASLAVGVFFSGRQKNTSGYFLGGGKMPGWLVGVSLSAAYVSAMTFLAAPGYSFQNDLRWLLPNFCFVIMGVFTIVWVVPFFRRVSTNSGYAFLEERFGTWARTYAAGGFLLFNMFRLGVILYVTALALEIFLGIPAVWLMLILGVTTTVYTMVGGFEAVVWTEFFQAIILAAGAALMLVLALDAIPGGFKTVWELGMPNGKFSLGNTQMTLTDRTLWATLVAGLIANASDYTTRQDFIQRYRAPRTLGQARVAVAVTFLIVVPLWCNFNILGTVLWAFYQLNPDPEVAKFAVSAPEKIVPYFMNTQIPSGMKGLLLSAILTAALSALASALNACSVTFVSDFYQRFMRKNAPERHYLALGRASTAGFGATMVLLALLVHFTRSGALQDLNFLLTILFSAGLFALFMLGLFSKKLQSRDALYASVATIATVVLWVIGRSAIVHEMFPCVAKFVPDLFWVPILSNGELFFIALLLTQIRKWRKGERFA